MNERGSLPGFVEAAMRDGAVSLRDSRGLMLISEARSLVRGASEFRKGDGHTISGHFVLESDRLWAALLSLKDADEFVREATRIQWFFQPRGRDNVAPFERYGAGILPWLMTFVRPDGRLLNVPWCVVPCFMQFVDADLFDFLWRVRSVVEESDAPGPGPYAAGEPGDVD